MMKRYRSFLASVMLLFAITACAALPFGGNEANNPDVAEDPQTPTVEVTPSPTATETSIPIAPTLGSEPTEASSPATATPATSEATAAATTDATDDATNNTTVTPTLTPTTSTQSTPVIPENDRPGISIDPQLSEPGVDIRVEGSGFEPGADVPLAWAFEALGDGQQFDTIEADENGAFTARVTVPASENWPGGSAEEQEAIYLQAVDTAQNIIYWAQFKYIPLVNPEDPVLKFDNPDQGYSVTVPNGWAWDWAEDDENAANVRFDAPTEVGGGFIRAYDSTDVDDVIATVMDIEFSGQNYTVSSASTGQYPGQQAVTDNGDTVFFYTNDDAGKTYAVYIITSTGDIASAVISTFVFL